MGGSAAFAPLLSKHVPSPCYTQGCKDDTDIHAPRPEELTTGMQMHLKATQPSPKPVARNACELWI